MKRTIALILFIAGASAALEVGETGLNHLRIQPDARISGMGGASSGIVENTQAFFANPAGLAKEGMALSVNYLPYPGGVHIGSVMFKPTRNTPGPFRYSVGVFYLNSGTMIMTSPTNDSLGTFGYHAVTVGGTGAYEIVENLSLGANLKLNLGAADTNIQLAAGVDVGAVYENLLPGLAIGLVVKNVAFEIKPFVSERSAIPVSIGGGVSYAGLENLTFALDVTKPLDAPLLVSGGAEYIPIHPLALRLGYSSQGLAWRTGDEYDILAGFSAGLGISDLAGVYVDYAITPGLDLGFFHRISLSYHF